MTHSLRAPFLPYAGICERYYAQNCGNCHQDQHHCSLKI